MIIKSLRKNCTECPPNITFFDNENPILELDLHEGHGHETKRSYMVSWRIKKDTPFMNMQRYEEDILAAYYDFLRKPTLTRGPHRIKAEYNYYRKGEEGCRIKQLDFFLLFGLDMRQALDVWDVAIHAMHEAFVSSNESAISFANHDVLCEMEFFLRIYSNLRSESDDFKEISFVTWDHYFPTKVFSRLLTETCAFPISQESAEEIVRLAETEQHIFYNPTT